MSLFKILKIINASIKKIGEEPALIALCHDNAWELLDSCLKGNCNIAATSTQAPATTPEGSGEGSGFEEYIDALFL